MVNTSTTLRKDALGPLTRTVGVYVAVALATIAALAIMSAADSSQATDDAWVHALIVAGFAILLPIRLRSARRGSAGALTAVRVIAAVLLAANLVEALIPGLFPAWMRIEMLGIAGLMVAVLLLALRVRR